MEVKGRSRKNKGRANARRRIRAFMSMVLTAAMVLGNMAVSVNTALAGAPAAREEFRIRTAAIQKAAEKALDEGEAITEEILIDGKDKSVLKAYQEMFKADGRLYELDILKDIETVKDVDGITLRVFMRIPEEADPKTHVLNGDEELYFLYVNDGEESVTARLNIEGLISGFSTVRPYEAVFGDKEKILENQGEAGTEEETESKELESKADEETGESAEGEEGADKEEPKRPAGGSGGSSGGSGGSGNISAGSAESSGSSEESGKPDDEDSAAETDGADTSDGKESTDSADHEKETEGTDNKENNDSADAKEPGSAEGSDDDHKGSEENKADEGKDDAADVKGEEKTDGAEQGGSSVESDKKEETGNKTDTGSSDKESDKGSSNDHTDSSSSSGDDKSDGGSSSSGDSGSDSSSSGSDSGSNSSSDSGNTSNSDSGSKGDSGSDSGKGSEDKGSSSDKGSSEDSGSSGDSGSVKEEAQHSLGISFNQILRVAEPDGAAEGNEADAEAFDAEEDADDGAEAGDAEESIETEEESEEETETEIETETEDEAEASEEETEEETEAEAGTEEAGAEEEGSTEESSEAEGAEKEESINEEDADSDYDEEGRALEEDEAAENVAEEEKDPFEKKGVLKGKMHNLVAFESGLTARVFVTNLKELGMSEEDLTEGGHILTYTVSPVGSAVVVNAPELVRDEAEVTFGVIPQIGYRIVSVMANGEELERVNGESLASGSNAEKALASASNGKKGVGYDESEAVYYVIPSVLESQEVEIVMAEEAEGTHPAFKESMTMSDGVTVTVSAEEGILPEGTYLQVEEVTDKVADAVKENVEAERNTTINTVIAYDINLMLDGKKLSNSYWSGNYVKVEFSGKRIEEISEKSDQISIAPIETPTEKIEAILGEAEEIPVLENISSEDIQVKMDECQVVQKSRNAVMDTFSIDARHFTVYVIMGGTQEDTIIINADAVLYGETDVIGGVGGYNPFDLDGKTYYYNSSAEQIIFKVPKGNQQEVDISGVTLVFGDGSQYNGDIIGVYHFLGGEVEKFIIKGNGELLVRVNIGGAEMELPYQYYAGEFRWIVNKSVAKKYDLYFYALLPDIQVSDADNAPSPDNNWYGIGLGYISGVRLPSDQMNNLDDPYVSKIMGEDGKVKRILIDGNDVELTLPEGRNEQEKTPYPAIEIDGKEYTYDATGNGNDTYSIRWIRTVLSNGANAGNNKYFTVDDKQYIYHRDGQLQINDGLHYTVTFNILQPNETEFEVQEGFSRRVETGFHETDLLKPDTKDKTVDSVKYVFDGWYLDEKCTQKASFNGTITKNTDYYGKYVSESQKTNTIQIRKRVSGVEQNEPVDFSGLEFQLKKSDSNWKSGNAVDLKEHSPQSEDGKEVEGTNYEKIFEFNVSDEDLKGGQAYYLLQEVTAPNGYQKIEGIIKIIVTKDKNGNVSVSLGEKYEDVSVEQRALNVINVVNHPVKEAGAILPDTGGPGLAMFERFGWFLLMIALLMAGMEVRFYGERKYRKAAMVQSEESEELW